MIAGKLNAQIFIEKKSVVADPVYGTEVVVWVPLIQSSDSPPVPVPLWAEWQDVLPSKAEAVLQGLAVARNQSRVRLRYRADIDSSMRVRRVVDSVTTIYQIVGGPAAIGKRKDGIELMVERFSS